MIACAVVVSRCCAYHQALLPARRAEAAEPLRHSQAPPLLSVLVTLWVLR